jgi:hypothetical protein
LDPLKKLKIIIGEPHIKSGCADHIFTSGYHASNGFITTRLQQGFEDADWATLASFGDLIFIWLAARLDIVVHIFVLCELTFLMLLYYMSTNIMDIKL